LNIADRHNKLQQVLSPNENDEGVWIHQDAWFHMGDLDKDVEVDYKIKKQGNGVYAFLLSGDVEINGNVLATRDGLGIWDVDSLHIKANAKAEILLMEVPMKIN
jgi:redox-sensitive bicupin YhaK (pirin superfamily)